MFQKFINAIVDQIVNPLILLLATFAFVIFLWGAFRLVVTAADDTKRKTAKDAVVWGLVGLVIIFGVYGILNIVTATFGLPAVHSSVVP